MPVPKNVTKRDAIATKGMLSCLILSTLDSQLTEKCPKMRIFQESPRVNGGNRFLFFGNFAPISSPGLLIMDQKLYRPTKLSTDMSVDYRPTLDRYIERLSSDYRPSVDQPSTECPPILLTDTFVKYRPTIGEKSAKCQ